MILIVATVWLYLWCAQSASYPYHFEKTNDWGYYNLLVDGFRSGHLWMDVTPDPALLKLQNPYDFSHPAVRMHDASFFKGKYYLYFGAAPVLVLFLPYRLITGGYLPTNLGTAIFCALGFCANAALVRLLLRRLFPTRSQFWWLVGIVVVGGANMASVLLRRGAFWEAPIAAAYAFCSLSLLFSLLAIAWPRRTVLWLILASMFYGLTIGSRPVYVFGAVSMLPLYWFVSRNQGLRLAFKRRQLTLALAAFVPVALIVAGIGIYNYERFENPFDFGMKWQMTGYDMSKWKMFDWRNVPVNVWYYFLAPAHWIRYFPFVQMISPAPIAAPKEYYGEDNVYGMLLNIPVILFSVFLVPLIWTGGRSKAALSGFLIVILCVAIGNAQTLVTFSASAARYSVDMVPYFVLLGLCGLWMFLQRLEGRPVMHWVVLSVAAAAITVSVVFGVFVGFQTGRLFEINDPMMYAKVAGTFNHIPAAFERISGSETGGLRLRMRFPKDRGTHYEPLVSTGWRYLSDLVFVKYGDGAIEFGFSQTNEKGLMSPVLPLDFDLEHSVDIEMGSLYPPAPHPWFAGMTPNEVSRYKREFSVRLDGREVLHGRANFYDSDPGDVLVGSNPSGYLVERQFTGTISEARRIAALPAQHDEGAYGPIQLLVSFPIDKVGLAEPLVVTGVTGAADILSVKYEANNRVRFAHDHWGYPLEMSDEIECAPGRLHTVDIWMSSLLSPATVSLMPWGSTGPAGSWCSVRVDGKEVWSSVRSFYSSSPQNVRVGQNAIGANFCTKEFTGTVTSWRRLPVTKGTDHIFELLAQFHQYIQPRTETMFSVGSPGSCVSLLVHYRATEMFFSISQFNRETFVGRPTKISATQAHLVSFRRENGDVTVQLDGQTVLHAPEIGQVEENASFWIGDSPPGFQTGAEPFSGRILSFKALP